MKVKSGFTLRRPKKDKPEAAHVSSSPPPASSLSVSAGSLPPLGSPQLVRPNAPAPSAQTARPNAEELGNALNKKLTLELKGKLLDMEEKARALEVAYKTRIASFIESVEPFVDRLRGESGEDALRDMFLQQLRILAEGKGDSNVVPSENPIQRQARLEALTSAIREQRSLVDFLAANSVSSGASVVRGDFQSLPFIASHFILEKLEKKDLITLASTCKHWQKRAKAVAATRVRTNLLLDFVARERRYSADLSLAIKTFGRAMEKHGLVDKTVMFLNMPVLDQASRVLVGDLRDRILHFSPIQLIGDVFVRLGPAFDLLLFFASGLESSLKLIKSLQSRPEANAIISELAVRLGRDVASFLLLPVKRGMETRDFLTAVLDSCPPQHADVPHLQRAAEQMRSVVEELDKRNKIDSVLDQIKAMPPRVKEIASSVLREGAVVFAEGPGRLFLCSGCIVLALEESSGSQDSLAFLNLLEFKPTPPVVLSSAEHAFAFDLQTSRGSTAVMVKSVDERISWMQSIKTAIDAFLRRSSALNVFATRKEPLVSSSRSTSMTVSRKTGMMLGKTAQVPGPSLTASTQSVGQVASPKDQKKMLTLGGRSKSFAKSVRGLQKRLPLVSLAEGTELFQLSPNGKLVHLDVHPASLSSDGAFVLMTPMRIICLCGPKLAPDSHVFAMSLKLSHDLSRPGVPVQVADQSDELFWTCFGGRYKLTEPTPKEVLDRYSGRYVVHVIHSNMQITEEDAGAALLHIRGEPCHFVFDAKDDVYVFCGAEAPTINKPLALAKADEVFQRDVALRPSCASIVEVDSSRKHPVFDLIVRLLTEVWSPQSGGLPKPQIAEDGGQGKKESGKSSPVRSGSPAAASKASKVSLPTANLPGRDWSTFECSREVDPQMERVDTRLSPRQAAAIAAQTMAAASTASAHPQAPKTVAIGSPAPLATVPSSKSPRSSIRMHKQKLDSIFDMLDKAPACDPTETDISYSDDEKDDVDGDDDDDDDSNGSAEPQLYIASPRKSQAAVPPLKPIQGRDRQESTVGLQEAMDKVYAEFSEEEDDVVDQILNV